MQCPSGTQCSLNTPGNYQSGASCKSTNSGGGQCVQCGLWQNTDGSTRAEGLCCASPTSYCACSGPLTGCGICESSCGADAACDGKEPGAGGCSNQCKFTGSSTGPCGSLGDVNNDGSVTSVDANLVQQHEAGLINIGQVYPGSLTRADVNGDGNVNSIDSNLILQYTGGLITAFPAC